MSDFDIHNAMVFAAAKARLEGQTPEEIAAVIPADWLRMYEADISKKVQDMTRGQG